MTLTAQGSYRSEDGSASYEWSMPDYSALDHKLCGLGLHIASRERVVQGWISYFSKVDRAYCACGSRCWIWFEDGWASEEKTEPGAHLAWIEGRQRMDEMFAEVRQRERTMYENHPCWGLPYKCISCGCSTERPCVSHRGGSR